MPELRGEDGWRRGAARMNFLIISLLLQIGIKIEMPVSYFILCGIMLLCEIADRIMNILERRWGKIEEAGTDG